MPDMPGMIADVKFILNDLGDQRRCPDPGTQPVSNGAAIQDIGQLFLLVDAQLGGPPAALPLQQAFLAMPVPGPDPGVDPGAVDLELRAIWPVVCPWTLSMMACSRRATRNDLSV